MLCRLKPGLTPPPPFVNHCQHLPYPPLPFVSNCQHFPTPPPPSAADIRGWSLGEIMEQAGAGFYKPGQQQRLLIPVEAGQDDYIKEMCSPEGLVLILQDFS